MKSPTQIAREHRGFIEQMSTAARDVLAERRRQMSVEGWMPDHDDTHDKGELADAAGSYALANHNRLLWVGGNEFPLTWPWHKRWWKPKSRREDLVRAGALIIAEIERLDRASSRSPAHRGDQAT